MSRGVRRCRGHRHRADLGRCNGGRGRDIRDRRGDGGGSRPGDDARRLGGHRAWDRTPTAPSRILTRRRQGGWVGRRRIRRGDRDRVPEATNVNAGRRRGLRQTGDRDPREGRDVGSGIRASATRGHDQTRARPHRPEGHRLGPRQRLMAGQCQPRLTGDGRGHHRQRRGQARHRADRLKGQRRRAERTQLTGGGTHRLIRPLEVSTHPRRRERAAPGGCRRSSSCMIGEGWLVI